MLGLLLYLSLIFTVQAIYVKDALVNDTDQKCTPTFKMIDASATIPTGISSGNIIDFGNFDQCLGIDEINNNSEIIKGKYCLVKLNISFPTNSYRARSYFKDSGNFFFEFFDPALEIPKVQERMDSQGIEFILGWCIPHTCPIKELTDVVSSVLGLRIEPIGDGVCQTKEDLEIKYDTENLLVITFLALTLLLMIISTLYDIYIQHNKKKPMHIILIAFSVKTNGQKLLSISNNPDQLPCLNGIRFISMMWVIIGHRFLQFASDRIINLTSLIDWTQDPINMYLLNAPLAVDTFFVLSGILIAYGFCLAKDKGVKFNIFLFYLHRYLRLTPVLAVVVWVNSTTLISFLGSGPFWPTATAGFSALCHKNWWAALLYIQNYYNYNEMCLGHTWYLSIDMQLFIIAPIILIPLWKWPKQTLIASTILVLASMASSFTVTYVYDLLTVMSDVKADLREYMINYYYLTHTRYGPWLMGIMLGYYLFKLKKNKSRRISLHPAQVAFGWIIGMGLLLSTMFAGYDLGIHPYTLGNSFYNGFYRHGWALGLCWVIYACTQGYGGPINAFLSWSPFQILGRFTYSIYLVHLILMYFITAANKTHLNFSNFNAMYAFWGDLMITFAISICLTLAYESPMVTIEKVLFKTGHKPKKSDLPVHHNTSPSKNR